MHYPGNACRGTDLPPNRILYIHVREATVLILSKARTLVPEFTVEHLPLDRTATLFPGFAENTDDEDYDVYNPFFIQGLHKK